MMARSLILFVGWLITVNAAAHPIHVSIVNIDCINDSNRIEMSVRLFYDDFQLLINHKYNTFLDFSQRTRMTTKEQQAITDYIKSTLILSDQNDSELETEFKGWKVEDMSVWLYFCAHITPEIYLKKLNNTLMLELFVDQKNLVIAHSKGNQKGLEFDKHNNIQQIDL
jgi:hypothetical protein